MLASAVARGQGVAPISSSGVVRATKEMRQKNLPLDFKAGNVAEERAHKADCQVQKEEAPAVHKEPCSQFAVPLCLVCWPFRVSLCSQKELVAAVLLSQKRVELFR